MSARYLDPADPALSDSDRQLSGHARAGGGVDLAGRAPAAAPAVDESGEFRIYLRRGDPNLVPGTVLGVARASDQSRLSTDLDWPGAADALTGQFLRTGGASYPILAHGSGPGTWFDVAHLDTPLRRRAAARSPSRSRPAPAPTSASTRPRTSTAGWRSSPPRRHRL